MITLCIIFLISELQLNVNGYQKAGITFRTIAPNSLTQQKYFGGIASKNVFRMSNTINEDLDDISIPLFVENVNRGLVSVVKDFVISYYGDRYFARFYALETIARVPYFSYGT